jgi:CubicO group peptidase (beta-lactamase class C family)
MITAPDAAHFVAEQPLEAEPGTLFDYSTGTTALLVGLAADELGGCDQADAYLQERLLDPIGITTEELMRDGRGCWLGGLGANMTTRDFARFGLLYLRGGSWDGQQVLSTDWIDQTRQPAATQPGYGLQWWLGEDGTSFSAEGLFGQRIIVVPGDDLVIAMNTTQGGDSVTPADAILAQFAALGG